MTNFNEWFNKKLVVGAHPYTYSDFDFDKYDFIINVSDQYYPYRPDNLFWFPMNECSEDIGINSIFGALIILDRCYRRNKSVYLHCLAGINRSKTVYSALYYMKTGSHIDLPYGTYKNALERNCLKGRLPLLEEMETFLRNLNIKIDLSENGMNHTVSLDKLKYNSFNSKIV